MKEFVKKNYYYDMILAAIAHERKAGKHLKSVILCRYNYDKLENWLKSVGILNDSNLMSRLFVKKVEIKRSLEFNPKEIDFEYFTKESHEEQLLDNFKLFGVENDQFIGDVMKKTGNTKKK